MVEIRKITTGPYTATETDSAQVPYLYPNAKIETEEAGPILDGSKMASRIGGMFEWYLGSAKIAATHTSSGRSTDRTASHEIAKVHWTSVNPDRVTRIDMALCEPSWPRRYVGDGEQSKGRSWL